MPWRRKFFRHSRRRFPSSGMMGRTGGRGSNDERDGGTAGAAAAGSPGPFRLLRAAAGVGLVGGAPLTRRRLRAAAAAGLSTAGGLAGKLAAADCSGMAGAELGGGAEVLSCVLRTVCSQAVAAVAAVGR